MRRFSERAAAVIYPSLSMILSCRSTRLLHLPGRLALIPYRVYQISGVLPPFALDYPPIPASMSTTPFSLPFYEPPQTLRWPPNPRPLWRSFCGSVKTLEHIFGFNPSNMTRSEDPLQRPCCIAARSGQCDVTTMPSLWK